VLLGADHPKPPLPAHEERRSAVAQALARLGEGETDLAKPLERTVSLHHPDHRRMVAYPERPPPVRGTRDTHFLPMCFRARLRRIEVGAERHSREKGLRVALLMEAAYESLADLRERAKAEVAKVVLGQDRAVELMLVAALARGHILLEGPPGSAKTLLGRAVAHMLGASFKRIQFTPDTTPSELTGQVGIKGGEPGFHPGAVFANVLLA